MSKFIQFNKENYDADGLITVYRGDDWLIKGKIKDRVGSEDLDVDLTGTTGASGFVPAASGGFMACLATVVDSLAGIISLSVPAANSPNAQASQSGAAPYIILSSSAGIQTLTPLDAPLRVLDRGTQGYP